MDDVLKDLAETAKERLFKSRFYGAWAVAFSLINWRTLYVLLFPSSAIDFFDRLDWVDGTLYPTATSMVWKIWGLPFATACFATALFPWFINKLEGMADRDLLQKYKNAIRYLREQNDMNLKEQTERENKIIELERTIADVRQQMHQMKDRELSKMKTLVEHREHLKEIIVDLKKGKSIRDYSNDDKMELLLIGVLRNFNDLEADFTEDGKRLALTIV